MQQFGVSVNQASSDLSRYIALAPDKMLYDNSACAYVPGPDLGCKFRPRDAAHSLVQLRPVARAALRKLNQLCNGLFPAGQAPIVALPVERVDIGMKGLNSRL